MTGGLWLQKAAHDFDYINAALGRPVMVTAMMTREVYGGDMPQDLWCSTCDLRETCPESPMGVARRGDDGGVGWDDHVCVFGEGITHQDSGSALIMYEGGVHASYTQNMVSRRSAGRRGAIITGYEATVDFDWYSGTTRVVDHMDGRVDTITVPDAEEGHSGGDDALARNFVDLCLGRDESKCDLTAGLLSASTCLAARGSSHSQTWLPVGDIREGEFPPGAETMVPTRADLEPVA